MNDIPASNPDEVVCETCRQSPCACKDKTSPLDAPTKAPRVKGSHRTGTAPKVKWL